MAIENAATTHQTSFRVGYAVGDKVSLALAADGLWNSETPISGRGGPRWKLMTKTSRLNENQRAHRYARRQALLKALPPGAVVQVHRVPKGWEATFIPFPGGPSFTAIKPDLNAAIADATDKAVIAMKKPQDAKADA